MGIVEKMVAQSIGVLCWWDFEDIAVTADDARIALAKHGMTEVTVPTLSHESEIRKSASEFRPTGFGRKEFWKANVVAVYDDGSMEVGLLRWNEITKDRSAAKKIEWTQEDSVVYDLNAKGWLYAGKTEAARQFVIHANRRMAFLGSDFVRSQVVNKPLLAAGAFPLRQRMGGFFFCPGPMVAKAEQIRNVIADLPGADAQIHLAHIQATDASASAVGQSAREHLGGQISTLMEKITEWRAAARMPRSDALATVISEFDRLREHAALYKDALGMAIDDISEQIEAAARDAAEISGLSHKGIPPVLITTLAAIIGSHGDITPVPYTAFMGTALPEEAATSKWWRHDKAQNLAREVGFTVEADKNGVKFTPIDEISEQVEVSPEEPPEEVTPLPATPEPESDGFGGGWAADEEPNEPTVREQLAKLTVAQLTVRLNGLGQTPPPRAGKERLIEVLAEALGA